MLTSDQAHDAIQNASGQACNKINDFAKEVLITRGGRIGSGMGTLLEALWGYYSNHILSEQSGVASECELAWMYGHEYNDFACVLRNKPWDPQSRTGELLRVEVKSMVASADESKAHFDQLYKDLSPYDLLVVLVWDWKSLGGMRVCPQIVDQFVGLARPIASLRDNLHLARGGSFVTSKHCPDECTPSSCTHDGEPLNEQGKRERLSGPEATRVSRTVSYAANFGGMVRMLKTDSDKARAVFREMRRGDDIAHRYITFIHKIFPDEELNQYKAEEWRQLAEKLDIQFEDTRKVELVNRIREQRPQYRETLRTLSS